MKVCWISAGVSSFLAGYFTKCDKYIYIDIKNQHPDSIRFIKDCENVLNHKIDFIKSSEYEDIYDVFYRKKFINSPGGAPCTKLLKKHVRKKWELDFLKEFGADEFSKLTYVWGYDSDEVNRKNKLLENFPMFNHEFPLIERGMNKNSVHGYFENHFNFKRPLMYDLGYSNNNCIGCVKGGKGYWNCIRRDFPDIFKKMCECERDLNSRVFSDIFLDELPPNVGKMNNEIIPDCDILCYLSDYS